MREDKSLSSRLHAVMQGKKAMLLGDRLKAARVAAGYTQDGLAHLTGVDERTIRNYEKHGKNGGAFRTIGPTLLKFLQRLNTDVVARGLCPMLQSVDDLLVLEAGDDPGEFGLGFQIPQYLTSFVGRTKELARLNELLLSSEHKAVCLVGVGGAGKTRLAVEFASRARDQFEHGAVIVPCVGMKDGTHLVQALLALFRMQGQSLSTPVQRLQGYLCQRRVLLLLDGLEHILDGERIVQNLAAAEMKSRLIVSSRTDVSFPGCALFPVFGLDHVWEPDGVGGEASAAKLMVARAVANGAPTPSTDQERAAVQETCRLLGGHPLALELVATWLCIRDYAGVLAKLRVNPLGLAGTNTGQPRDDEVSLKEVFEDTLALLNGRLRQVLWRLAIFTGGITEIAAERVALASTADLISLSRACLVRRRHDGRLEVHDLIRCAVLQSSQPTDENQALAIRLRSYYCGFLHEAGLAVGHSGQANELQRTRIELANIKTAWNLEGGEDKTQFFSQARDVLMVLLDVDGNFRKTIQLCEVGLAVMLRTPNPDAATLLAQARLHNWKTFALLRAGMIQQAAEEVERARMVATQFGDPIELALATHLAALVIIFEAPQEALSLSQASIRILSAAQPEDELSRIRKDICLTGFHQFQLEVARERGMFQQAWQSFTTSGGMRGRLRDDWMRPHTYEVVGTIATMLGNTGVAHKLIAEGMACAKKLDSPFIESILYLRLVELYLSVGNWGRKTP